MNSKFYNNYKTKVSSILVLSKLWKNTNKGRRRQIFLSFILMITSGFAEVATLASLFPFLSALTNPERLWDFKYIKQLSIILGFYNPNDLILPLTIIFIITAIISSFIRLLNLWFYNKVAVSMGSDLSCEVYKRVLYLPYIIHTKINSSEYISIIVNQVSRSVEVISQFLQLFTGIILMISLVIALLITNFSLTVIATLIFGSIYIFISKKTKAQLLRNSQRVSESRSKQIKSLQEGLGAIRDVLMSGNQSTYLSLFRKNDIPMRRYEAQKNSNAIKFKNTAVDALCPLKRRRLGLACVPEDRLGRGAVPDMDLAHNALLTSFDSGLVKKGFLVKQKISQLADKIIKKYNVKTPCNRTHAASLSGGNLQKFIIGREVEQNPQLLVMSHPTWGVDIGAQVAIHEAILTLRDEGCAVLVISEDLDELYKICDRIGAICDGRLSPILNTDCVPLVQLGQWMAGDFNHDTKSNTAKIIPQGALA